MMNEDSYRTLSGARSPWELRASVVLSLWLPADPQRAADVTSGPDGVHHVRTAEGFTLLLRDYLPAPAALRRTCALLPTISDALMGPPGMMGAQEAVLIERSDDSIYPPLAVLVPEEVGTSVTWSEVRMETPVAPLDPSFARREIHRTTEYAITALTESDLMREQPQLADELTDIVTAVLDPRLIPPTCTRRQRELLERALRLEAICAAAMDTHEGLASAAQIQERAAIIRPLAATARSAMSAATQWWA